MNYNSLTKEDIKWLSRLEDLRVLADKTKTPKFTKFCDARLLYVAKNCMSEKSGFCAFGGYSGSERAIIGFFPDYMDADTSLFPVSLLKIEGASGLSHRDFLGSILGLGINRDVIGDILVGEDATYVFVHSQIEDYIIFNLEKVAQKRVQISSAQDFSVLPERKFEEVFGTVSSERLDAVVSMFTHKSRADVQKAINSEHVFLNHIPCTNASQKLKEGDVISVRKFGKAKLFKIGTETKKGRIRIVLYKYV